MIIANQKDRGILIVDDEAAIRRSLSERFRKDGFTKVFCAEDGLSALTCLELEGQSIYVIITDVVMPAMDGVKLAEYLTTNYHHPTGIIFMSGFADRQDEFEVKSFDENGEILNFEFFSKPFSAHTLIQRVLQCGDLVFNRRISLSRYSIEHVSDQLETLDRSIEDLKGSLSDLDKRLGKQRGLLEELGFEVIKVLIIAGFVVVMLLALDGSRLINALQRRAQSSPLIQAH